MPKSPLNTLYHGDNLDIIRSNIDDESVDLIYLDPPFMSDRNYSTLFEENDGVKSHAQIKVFEDTWHWDQAAVEAYQEIVKSADSVSKAVVAFKVLIGEGDMLAYLSMMALRLVELKRVLKATGSIYLHCNSVASHYLKLLMDTIFGRENFLNQIVWCYGLGGSTPRRWSRKHDDILWYSKQLNQYHFEPVMIPATSQRMKGQLKKAPDYWLIPTLNNMANERLGYPTQKPEELLERIIISSSREGGVVLDPFCGSGTTIAVAQKLNRNWIGIDMNKMGIDLTRKRLDAI